MVKIRKEKRERSYGRSHWYGSTYSGVFLLLIGLYFLLQNFGLVDIDLGKFWPIFLIIPGIYILLESNKK